jgi:hypothetical protein
MPFNETTATGKDAVMAYFKLASQDLRGGTEEIREKLQVTMGGFPVEI